MAAKLYSINTTTPTTRINDIQAALNDKSLITATLYKDSDCLIFSTPLTSKVIKIKIGDSSSRIFVYYGDAWTSSEAIVNESQFSQANRSGNYLISMKIVADSTYFIILTENVTYPCNLITYVGALDNGDVLIFGSCGENFQNSAMNMTTGVQVMPITFSYYSNAKDSSGNFYTMPLMWAETSGKAMQLNGTVPAQTLGIKVASVITGNITMIHGNNYILTTTPMLMSSAQVFQSALLIEYTE